MNFWRIVRTSSIMRNETIIKQKMHNSVSIPESQLKASTSLSTNTCEPTLNSLSNELIEPKLIIITSRTITNNINNLYNFFNVIVHDLSLPYESMSAVNERRKNIALQDIKLSNAINDNNSNFLNVSGLISTMVINSLGKIRGIIYINENNISQ